MDSGRLEQSLCGVNVVSLSMKPDYGNDVFHLLSHWLSKLQTGSCPMECQRCFCVTSVLVAFALFFLVNGYVVGVV